LTKNKRRTIYTIGHSTRKLEEFIRLLEKFEIKVLIDVRRFPTSRKFPHFKKEMLENELHKRGIDYIWLGAQLGGKRSVGEIPEELSPWKNWGFKNYVVYCYTSDEWKKGFHELISIANKKRTVIMCAEKLPWRCHRWILSEILAFLGFEVIHIIDEDRTIKHKLSEKGKYLGELLKKKKFI